MVSTFMKHHANRSRTMGSRSRPYSRASATSRSNSARKRIGLVAASSPRSCDNNVIATDHPAPTVAHDVVDGRCARR